MCTPVADAYPLQLSEYLSVVCTGTRIITLAAAECFAGSQELPTMKRMCAQSDYTR
eukprot:m.1216679 g.1216679  ORF g.1216679 m.1216679 type:complete len:56 (+) comp24614_c0_seq16:1127-1294(+)